MKLYTEEQVIQILYWMSPIYMGREQVEERIKKELTPIELPNDEEIKKLELIIRRFNNYAKLNGYPSKSFKEKVNKILNQNK